LGLARHAVLLVNLSPGSPDAYAARAVLQLLLIKLAGRVQWSHVGEIAPSDITQARALVERH